jgi:subtilisin family serine protease
MAALLLLAAAAVICSSDASFDALGDSRREAHLEPADEAGHRTYIVLLEAPPAGSSMDADAARAWHQSFLPSMTTSLGEPRLRRSYQTVVHGFSARLTEDELEIVSAKPGFVRAFPNVIRYKETTLTPAFLGLEFPQPTAGKRFENWPGFGGLATIIGVIDGGIANAHPSMDDAGFEEIEVPERWSGSCHEDMKCNKKLIGARNFVGAGPPLDSPDGHGTHVTTIAAGNFVAGANFRGLASGNASGMAPQAHVAVYKACGERSCTDEPLLAAIDAAVKDGVDVISLSVGGSSEPTYDHDPIAVGSFGAMRAGVLVVAAAGNGGPSPSTVHNDAPWLLTVGAGTVDRSLAAGVELDDTTEVNGQSLTNRQWQAANRPVLQHEVLYRQEGDRPNCVYPEDELPELVPDRVVICQAGGEMTGKNLEDLKSNNASAIILVDKEVFGHTGMVMEMAGMENTYTPLLQVTYEDGGILKSFASYSPRKPMVLIDFNRGTVVGGATPAPTVAFLSARGPSRYYPAILKPDVLAPGINILGGVPPYQAQPGGATEYFKFMSGTSMAVPHVSGAAVLLRCAHYDWGPAAIR